MATDKKALKKMFPHLYEELETGDAKIPINAVRKNPEEAEGAVDCEDCEEEEEAEEIIAYLQKKGEITQQYAEELRCQLKREGVRSFGPKKEENYYFRE